jgi:nitrilase
MPSGNDVGWWFLVKRWCQAIRSGWSQQAERDSIRLCKRRSSPNTRPRLFSWRPDISIDCAAAARNGVAIYLGCVERAADRGGHSLYCSLVFSDQRGDIRSVHRKLMPTYEERLVWSAGDGQGLCTHKVGAFQVGGLNCWENWMPLARSSLYAQGENLHVAVWPGGTHNTRDITRFIAMESRSYVASVSGLMRREDIGDSSAWRKMVAEASPEVLATGGSCIAGPDGEWLVAPSEGEEKLLTATIDLRRVFEERQNFDPSGHYARPDVTRLEVNRKRQNVLSILPD